MSTYKYFISKEAYLEWKRFISIYVEEYKEVGKGILVKFLKIKDKK